MPRLFSYGTLQLEKVQLETFGRILTGEKEVLSNYKINEIEILDEEVIRKSNQKFHPIIEHTGNLEDKVSGILFEVTEKEILQADEYEVKEYKRIKIIFDSGKIGFIYVKN